MSVAEVLILVLMLIGVVGIVIPVLPGLLVVLAGSLAWALKEQTTLGWVVFGLSALVYLLGVGLQWAVPGQRMRRAGVRTSTLVIGVVCALVLGVLIPVVGLFLGFPLGIFLVSLARTRDRVEALRATRHALHAVGLNILIELATAFTLIAMFVVGAVVLTPA
ncbi:hypothetical protein AVL62_01525 [Serinicoccus chungangensis]|uniref:DUF456 domain-containing protein n=1 Tax=Serinicoccus chungangensis TaxID=767452 RepID=A0A0W8I5M4_9MICO|nr:DUF456 domain-containing protein [Serinicoccus chungangensis]KUG53500.1 hypothetical protein AVL62_01525 [Serinicoccus chungangensis]